MFVSNHLRHSASAWKPVPWMVTELGGFRFDGNIMPFGAIVVAVEDRGRIQSIMKTTAKGHLIPKQIFTDRLTSRW
uniref:Uncharacterized protein n=1 Tax=Candidatus Kentrum sp. LFY TaxID=2126342 RepID=A0A450WFK6_9GAMM|nr:MAG: hypothetical protein BECKLFY1418C_GA0070996_101818 [Candidatus Kentron sp. LFY]